MEALFIYIIKSASLILLFYCAYYFLLRKETFFNSNRWFLLSGLLVSAILPLFVYTKTIWIDTVQSLDMDAQSALPHSIENESFHFNWIYFMLGLYTLGFLVFMIKFALDFYSLNSILRGKKIQQQADFKFVDVNDNIAPFSYFEYIVYNSSMFTPSELENIIAHEKVHSDQNHTIDVLISRLFTIIFWFNPIVWLYKKAITQNLEFIADSEAAKKLLDKKAYQYTLLKITTHESCVAITNHFYQSLIKKRIVMLNKNQSKKRNSWKYYTVIPVLAAFVLLFQVEVVAKEKQQIIKDAAGEIKSVDVYKIRKSSTDADLKQIKEKLKSIHNIDFEASEIKRNAENELTSIIIDVKNGSQEAKSIQTAGNQTIKDFGVVVITDQNGIKKVGIQTDDTKVGVSKEINLDSKTTKGSKTVTGNKIIIKTDTNDNTNSITSTKTNTNNNTNSSTNVNVNTDTNSTTITVRDGSTIAVSNSVKTNKDGKQLIIIDGEEKPSAFSLDDINSNDIKTMNVYKGEASIAKFGEKGKNGVIVIETRK
ncbi:M56 family metallopeptidase [Flavobacterium sp. HTF]|uniref:M56 family metallopeptidase n=1 Tax=Flavobacterium sp. HTF TaxID=2170732 RepID=UPI000D5D3EB7|nr:M56 family metallopeptidase [Flavobacterium sp. HTF]PWB23687.1 peptidase M56 [Flavobacterium sp. HTF]